MPKFSQIAAAGVNPVSGTQFLAVTSGTTDNLYTIDEIAATVGSINGYGKQLATANVSVFVNPATGSDSNPGTSSLPFKTIAKAVSTVLGFDYVGLWNPVINLANGTYSNVNQLLPPLLNVNTNGGIFVGDNTTPTNVSINDGGTGWTFTVLQNSSWGISGVSLDGTFGGILQSAASTLDFEAGKINFGGSFANAGLQTGGSLNGYGCTLSTTASTMHTLILSGGFTNLDHATINFANPITFSNAVIIVDDGYGFFAFDNGAFTNAGNVTMAVGQTALAITNGGIFETNPSTTSNGSPLTRANFPGAPSGGVGIDGFSIFEPDNGIITTAQAILGWSSGASGAGVVDTGISRSSFGAGIVSVGNGTWNDTSGILITKDFLASAGGICGFLGPGLSVGGTVTQLTSKSTAVTLNTSTGAITMNAAALAAGTSVSFTFSNNTITGANESMIVKVSGVADPTAYVVMITPTGAGAATVFVRNISAGSLSEAVVLTFSRWGSQTN